MSDDREELELKALQRELDDAFETTRPRRGFEDELWSRIQRRRPVSVRVRDLLSGLPAAFGRLPAVPTAAVAAVLVIAIGLGVIAAGGGLHIAGGNALSETGSAPNPAVDHANNGLLPTPVLHPGYVDSGVQAVPAAAPNGTAFGPLSSSASAHLYFGPATMDWTGTFASAAVDAPVLLYTEPGLPQADQFAAALGASTSKQVRQVNGFLGTYAGADFTVSIRGSVAQLPREPFFVLTPSPSVSVAGDTPAAIADQLLARFSLVPSWPYTVIVQQSDQHHARVVFARQATAGGGATADFVDWLGERYGIEVDITDGRPVLAFGELPLPAAPAGYKLIANDAAARVAVTAQASGPAVTPTPVVHLDQAQLVYALAVTNGQGYFEPAYLFSGTFAYNGETYVKRVLVPLVDPSLRSS